MVQSRISLTVNGVDHVLDVPVDAPLLNILRNDLCLNGPKFGCGLGECGACTVLVGGRAARSCSVPVGVASNWPITTLEGLETQSGLDVVQKAFVQEQAAQCGYCLNGMIITLRAFLDFNPNPDREEIRRALRFNLCRCGTHVEILNAAMRACGLTTDLEVDHG